MRIFYSFILLLAVGCSIGQSKECVDVDYYNSNTGKQSSYRLTAKIDNNQLLELNFPNGGHIDEEDFGTVHFKNNLAITNVKGGKTYRVKRIGKNGDCFNDVPLAKQCKGKTADGTRCKNQTDNTSGYCWKHN